MLQVKNTIDPSEPVRDIVTRDYRTAVVFRKYAIDFCCGAKFSLELACASRDLDISTVKQELEKATQTLAVSNYLKFDQWDLDFLTDYIVHIHHQYLKVALPEILDFLTRFTESHKNKHAQLPDLLHCLRELSSEIPPHLVQEEEIIFPYIKQMLHAYRNKEPYARLLVRTLSKPVKEVMVQEHQMLTKSLGKIRELTQDYSLPANACTNHRVSYSMLTELDNDLVQHFHLENNILFPKAIAMERELLQES
jgi:regulator of cell morphogenesis and NO signaling